ncbi:MAG: hypothetical protein HC843_09770 [Sphingomonadales bacterium]|nr:hypothetical protein [Sphingomonadales bacterium]
MHMMKTAMFAAMLFAGLSAAPALAITADNGGKTATQNSSNDDGQATEKRKDASPKPNPKNPPRREACRTCRILM